MKRPLCNQHVEHPLSLRLLPFPFHNLLLFSLLLTDNFRQSKAHIIKHKILLGVDRPDYYNIFHCNK